MTAKGQSRPAGGSLRHVLLVHQSANRSPLPVVIYLNMHTNLSAVRLDTRPEPDLGNLTQLKHKICSLVQAAITVCKPSRHRLFQTMAPIDSDAVKSLRAPRRRTTFQILSQLILLWFVRDVSAPADSTVKSLHYCLPGADENSLDSSYSLIYSNMYYENILFE